MKFTRYLVISRLSQSRNNPILVARAHSTVRESYEDERKLLSYPEVCIIHVHMRITMCLRVFLQTCVLVYGEGMVLCDYSRERIHKCLRTSEKVCNYFRILGPLCFHQSWTTVLLCETLITVVGNSYYNNEGEISVSCIGHLINFCLWKHGDINDSGVTEYSVTQSRCNAGFHWRIFVNSLERNFRHLPGNYAIYNSKRWFQYGSA